MPGELAQDTAAVTAVHADDVWRALTAIVYDNRDSWKRAVIERSGLPFSRVRVLRRLARRPMSVKEVAHAATMDPPAATVAVNDLEERGLVTRQVDPANRRCKTVSITQAGLALWKEIEAVDDPAPEPLAALDPEDLQTLHAILSKVSGR
ncbi:MarR family winged helix-turn-helix transcriptional regulator [Mycolicibacterium smegmatis]|jgi:DNA-binding MarR family transcriptional regulator|uniref:Putative transcriptional regulator n=1 Tax=Mycolicibacterium smegmatis (strain MKD8) TaxID=1214915 RepID=A0A2U9PXJ2_MYCSE|nr:MarR family transcriptional regulator [Mycolicibacterium smegmatis]AWT56506.1 putative transcriptional regulator [Mycolicibacterium smegmatis MKD8]ULN34440.1 MarR family transcriptional regulator [Mycolicibacterium smegmatis]